MQNICLHIEYLLRYHDCVIVPGIGAFLLTRRPAEFREADGTLLPSRKEICFNGSITSDDGLLAHSLSRKESIGFEQARNILAETVEAMRTALNEDGELSFGRIGTLEMDAEGVISFLPGARSQFAMSAITTNRNSGKISDSSAESQKRFNPYYTFRIPRRVVRYAAMLAIVVMSAFSLSTPVSDRTIPVDHASVVPLPVSTQIETPAQDSAVAAAGEVETPRYYLIVGASKSAAKCEEFIAQHPDFELNQVASGTSTLIYVASSEVREELALMMRTDEVKAEFGQTWIYDSHK